MGRLQHALARTRCCAPRPESGRGSCQASATCRLPRLRASQASAWRGHSLWMMSGPIVDSMILSMAEPRSEEVDAVESDTIVAPSAMTLE